MQHDLEMQIMYINKDVIVTDFNQAMKENTVTILRALHFSILMGCGRFGMDEIITQSDERTSEL